MIVFTEYLVSSGAVIWVVTHFQGAALRDNRYEGWWCANLYAAYVEEEIEQCDPDFWKSGVESIGKIAEATSSCSWVSSRLSLRLWESRIGARLWKFRQVNVNIEGSGKRG